MASKSLKILSLSILFLVAIIGAVSALTLTPTTDGTQFSQSDDDSLTINVSDVNGTASFSYSEVKDYSGKQITFDPEGDVASGDIEITTVVPEDFDFFGKSYSTVLTVTDDDETKTITLTFEQTSFCEWNNGVEEDSDNHIRLKIEDISVVKGFGEDNEWYPEDEVEIELKVENRNSNDDIDDITIEWGIFDKDSGRWVIDVDDEKDFNLKDGDKETKIISFKLDDLEEDFDELGDLVFYVRATGDDEEAGDVCSSESEDIKVITDDNFVVLSNIEMEETASCGDELHITADVWNIGDEDQDEVDVIIYNKELGINEKVSIGDISSFDNEKLDITITLPTDVDEKQYDLLFAVYDEDGELYENDNDDKSEFFVPVTIKGSCAPSVIVDATLESGAVAGKELIVRVTLTNTGSESADYTLSLIDYGDWAILENMESSEITLDAGESKDVLVTFIVNKEVSGDRLFNIEVLSDGKTVLTQPVSVTIDGKTGFSFAGITGNMISEGNWYLWGIGALNVLLVVVIIIVALKVAKKSE